MSERPMLFSGPMVRALLAGTKTQTRRIVKLPHNNPLGTWEPTRWETASCVDSRGRPVPEVDTAAIWHTRTGDTQLCPYGHPGDWLWVRETWGGSYTDIVPTGRQFIVGGTWGSPSRPGRPPCVVFRADGEMPDDSPMETGRWCPSIHMPRWASRITMEITGVRVERLQDISEDDCYAEGALEWANEQDLRHDDDTPAKFPSIRRAYQALWESINGADSWAANPWVWVVEFKVLRK